MTKKQWLALWLAERDQVIRTQDIERFKAFYKKWKARGIYTLDLPRDEVIEVSLRKMLYNLKNATAEEKATAEKWLKDRGLSTDLD